MPTVQHERDSSTFLDSYSARKYEEVHRYQKNSHALTKPEVKNKSEDKLDRNLSDCHCNKMWSPYHYTQYDISRMKSFCTSKKNHITVEISYTAVEVSFFQWSIQNAFFSLEGEKVPTRAHIKR